MTKRTNWKKLYEAEKAKTTDKDKEIKRLKDKYANGSFKEVGIAHCEEFNVLGITRVKLCGTWIKSKVSMDMLSKVIEIQKALDKKHDSVDIVFTEDHPVIFGSVNKEKMEVAGIMIAPRVDNS